MKGFDYSAEIKDSKTYTKLFPLGKSILKKVYEIEYIGTENIPMENHAVTLYVGTFHAATGLMSEAYDYYSAWAVKNQEREVWYFLQKQPPRGLAGDDLPG